MPRIIQAAEALIIEPFPNGCEKLSGTDRTYRVRIGDYRLIYEVDTSEKTIVVQRVRHRKDVYRQ